MFGNFAKLDSPWQLVQFWQNLQTSLILLIPNCTRQRMITYTNSGNINLITGTINTCASDCLYVELRQTGAKLPAIKKKEKSRKVIGVNGKSSTGHYTDPTELSMKDKTHV